MGTRMKVSGIGCGTMMFLVLLGFSPKPVRAAPTSNPKSWQQKMRTLEQTYQDLLIDLSSNERFNNPKNFQRIEKNSEKLAKAAQELNTKGGQSPDADPSIPMIANHFAGEANRAYKTLKSGHREYARSVLKSMTGYCIACHTRSGGVSFQNVTAAPSVQALNSYEKAEFFAATRQFDSALNEYEKTVADPKMAESRPFNWEKAVRSGLAVAVRVKKDPERALGIVEHVLAAQKAPYFLKEQAVQWKNNLISWKSEGKSNAQSEEGYYVMAIRLIGEAKALQKYPTDRSADILYLRASSAVHDLMSFAPNGRHATEALYLAGLCYEVLQDLHLWDMHEYYYLACIMKSPHSDKSRECFNHYERSVYFGYTGSGGTHLPSEVRNRLIELDQLSRPIQDKDKETVKVPM